MEDGKIKGKLIVSVIEDDGFLGNLVVKRLLEAGFETVLIKDGEQAIEYLKNSNPHCILLDIRLPKKDGFEVLAWMKESGKSNIPVVVLSNLNQESDHNRAMEFGVKDYIVKANHTLEEIVERVQKVIHQAYL